jgi:outer membrane biosynthesis protein TonB
MVEDEEILELVHANRDDLDKAVKALVTAANRGGGEDNITAVAFRISAEAEAPAANLEDTVSMPALAADEDEPDEQTREQVQEPEPEPEPEPTPTPPAADARRVRLVLLALVLLLLAAAAVIWGLSR